VLELLILIICMGLLIAVLGLPLILGSDSPIPDYLGFGILAVPVALFVWGGVWWILLPIAFLAALVIWMDRGGQHATVDPAALDHRGWSGRTRLRFRLWCLALFAPPLLFGSIFVLPEGSLLIVVPSMVVAMAAMSLFRFSFYRSAMRDEPG
jgi:hypothetical protein